MQVIVTPFNQQERNLSQVGPQGPQGPQGVPGKNGIGGGIGDGAEGPIELPTLASGTFTIIAKDHIEAYSLVCMSGYICDSNIPSLQNQLAGVAMDEAWPGMELLVCFNGVVEHSGWNWAPNQKLWADGKWFNPQVPVTGWNQLIGMTTGPNSIFIRLSPPILL